MERLPIAHQNHRFILEVDGLVPMGTMGDRAAKSLESRHVRPFPFVQDSSGTDEDVADCCFGFASLRICGGNRPGGGIFMPLTPVDCV